MEDKNWRDVRWKDGRYCRREETADVDVAYTEPCRWIADTVPPGMAHALRLVQGDETIYASAYFWSQGGSLSKCSQGGSVSKATHSAPLDQAPLSLAAQAASKPAIILVDVRLLRSLLIDYRPHFQTPVFNPVVIVVQNYTRTLYIIYSIRIIICKVDAAYFVA